MSPAFQEITVQWRRQMQNVLVSVAGQQIANLQPFISSFISSVGEIPGCSTSAFSAQGLPGLK